MFPRVRAELNLDVTAIGAFLEPVDISGLAEIGCLDKLANIRV